MTTIRSFVQGLPGVHAANPDVRLRFGHDAASPDQGVLIVEYPPPNDDPAARDVWCDAEHGDWTAGSAITFHVNPDGPEKLSVSFIDRNSVVYTTWVDLEGGVWQPVRIEFDELRPNPYFQPPEAKTGAPLDRGDVGGIAFAPHGQRKGRLTLGTFVLSR